MGNAEYLLLAGIAAFYLYDSALLLFSEEVLFMRWRGGWRASVGSDFTLGGRYLALPALLLPGTPILRAHWPRQDAVAGDDAGASMDAMARRLRPLAWSCRLVALLLFVAVPLALLRHWPSQWLLGLLLAIYLPTAVAVAWLAWQRQALGLSRAVLATIALDVLACPPFAPNLVRRVSLRMPLADPAAFAREVLPAARERTLVARIEQRIGLLLESDRS